MPVRYTDMGASGDDEGTKPGPGERQGEVPSPSGDNNRLIHQVNSTTLMSGRSGTFARSYRPDGCDEATWP